MNRLLLDQLYSKSNSVSSRSVVLMSFSSLKSDDIPNMAVRGEVGRILLQGIMRRFKVPR